MTDGILITVAEQHNMDNDYGKFRKEALIQNLSFKWQGKSHADIETKQWRRI